MLYRLITAISLYSITDGKLLGKRYQPANSLYIRPPYKSGCTMGMYYIPILARNSLALWLSIESIEYKEFLFSTLLTIFRIDLLHLYSYRYNLAVLIGRLLNSKSLSGI